MKKTKKNGKKNNILNYIWKKKIWIKIMKIYNFFHKVFLFILKFEKLENNIFPYEEKNQNK